MQNQIFVQRQIYHIKSPKVIIVKIVTGILNIYHLMLMETWEVVEELLIHLVNMEI